MFVCSSFLPFRVTFVLIMSVASSSELTRRRDAWVELLRDLTAAGVPVEAHPGRGMLCYAACYASYSVRGPRPERNPINVLPLVRRFLIPSQVTRGNHSTIIDWGDDAAGAWRDAKRLARW